MEQSRLVPETIDRCCTEVHDSAAAVSTPFEPNIAQECMFQLLVCVQSNTPFFELNILEVDLFFSLEL